ncbi:MAG: ABC transporter substrate-binding protein [Spirochaetia bacterium]|nr:ABC transporter substrate-binding protein [Spirochaetia bacterium]
MRKNILLILLVFLMAVPCFAFGTGRKELKELNISYVRDPFNLPLIVMKEKQIADRIFAEKGIKVNYFEISSGAKQSEAIAAGSLHIASVINTASVILANAGGNPVEIFGGFSRPGKVFAIMNYNGKVTKPADLRGKTIAGPKGSFLHELLVAALVKEGMTIDDVNFINMTIPSGIAAMLSGKVDCCMAAASSVINAEKAGAEVVFTCEGYVEPLLVSACGRNFAEKYPDIIDAFKQAKKESLEWMENNLDEAIAIAARIQDISIDEAERLYSWIEYCNTLSDDDLQALDHDIDFMLETGMIDHPVDKMSFVSEKAFR